MTSTPQPETAAKQQQKKAPDPSPIGFENEPKHDPLFDGTGYDPDLTTAQALAILAAFLGTCVLGVVALRRIWRQLRVHQADKA